MYAPWEEIRDARRQFISINPQRTASDELLNAEWVKIVPNTDMALFSAMAYHVLEKGLEDRAYLDTYTVGSDKWIAYLKGETDGAAEDAGLGRRDHRHRRREDPRAGRAAGHHRNQIAGAWSLQRAQHGEMTHWAIINFSALTGQIGKPGQGVGLLLALRQRRACRNRATRTPDRAEPGPQLGQEHLPCQPDHRDAGKPRQGVHL